MERATEPSRVQLGNAVSSEWVGGASNAGFLALGAFVLLEGAVLQLMLHEHPGAGVLLMVVHGLLVVVLELQSKIQVRIDERALTIRYGRLRLLRQRVPLERIVTAHAVQVDPMEDYKGWGYRGNLRWLGKAGVIVRAGSALRLDLQGGKHFAITVDDAETAARHLGALLRRPPEPPSPEPA